MLFSPLTCRGSGFGVMTQLVTSTLSLADAGIAGIRRGDSSAAPIHRRAPGKAYTRSSHDNGSASHFDFSLSVESDQPRAIDRRRARVPSGASGSWIVRQLEKYGKRLFPLRHAAQSTASHGKE